jgi:hypothetical protein
MEIEFLLERLATLRGECEERALKAQGFNIRAQNVDKWVGAIAEQLGTGGIGAACSKVSG